MSPEFFEKIKSLSYNDTPYIQKEEVKATKLTASQKNRPKEGSESKEDSTESFGDFAWRKLSGKEHGDVIEFGNNEVFYIKPVKKEEAQKLGDFLTEMEFFSDENEASVQLLHNNINANYEVRFVINEDLLTDEVIAAFELYRIMIQRGVLDGKPTAVHLCNNRLVTIKTLREE